MRRGIKLCGMEDKLARLGRAFWQFEIASVELPHFKARGKVGEIEGEWWLKVWGERLLFCAASTPERVFAVVTPCEGEADLVAFWRAAVERGDWGEVFFHPQHLTANTHEGFLTIFVGDRVAWTREWCGGKWIERKDITVASIEEWKRKSWEAANGETSFYHSPFRFEAQPYRVMEDRYFPERRRQNFKPSWMRGSRAEWKSVLQACVLLFGTDKELPPGFRTRTFVGFAHTPFSAGWFYGVDEEEEGFWVLPQVWRTLFRQHFVYIGWRWIRRESSNPNLRSSWEVLPFTTQANIRFSRNPSQHEQLEAKLILRDWLRGKVSEEEIKKLLG